MPLAFASRLTAAAALVVGALLCAAPPPGAAAAAPTGGELGGDYRTDRMIERAFRDVLGRAPHDDEYRRYRRRVDEDGWNERDIREDLEEREDDRGARGRGDRRSRPHDVDRVIRRAYEDILDRSPDTEGLRHYRRRMIDDGWSEHQVREALRKSPEARVVAARAAERAVTRAYEDVLGRAPDPPGLALYTRRMLQEDWDEHDVRRALARSPEARQKRSTVLEAEAQDIVRRAYRNVLGRDPDPAGMAVYGNRVVRDRWTQADVERALRKSDESRNRR